MYLFISRKCRHCRQLLAWIAQARGARLLVDEAYDGTLKVIDVDTLACRGVSRRVGRVPGLVTPGRGEPFVGLESICRALSKRTRGGGGGVTRSSRRGEATIRRRPLSSVRPPPHANAAFAAAVARRELVGAGSSFPRPENTSIAGIDDDLGHTSTDFRDRKISGLEQDLEMLIAQRNNIPSTGIQRVG